MLLMMAVTLTIKISEVVLDMVILHTVTKIHLKVGATELTLVVSLVAANMVLQRTSTLSVLKSLQLKVQALSQM